MMKSNNTQKKRKFSHYESKSLWNYTLSPGWSIEEVTILKKALQKYGIGKWKKIMQSKCLPGKSIGQIYMQTQRLIGQQSLGDFMGLHVDLEKIFLDNMKKTGVVRKNNCIINTGDNPTREERKKRIEQNKREYGLTIEEIRSINLPRIKCPLLSNLLTLDEIESDKFTTIEKLNNLDNLKQVIERKLKRIEEKEIQMNEKSSCFVLTLQKLGKSRYCIIENPEEDKEEFMEEVEIEEEEEEDQE